MESKNVRKTCYSIIVVIVALAANDQASSAPDVDFMRVCDQVMSAFTDCGYPDPGIAAHGGCSEEIGRQWAAQLGQQIAQNKSRLESMRGADQNLSADDENYKKLACMNSKYETIHKGLQ